MPINKTTILLFGSILTFIYFSLLIIDSYQLLNIPNSFQIFGELLTIPLLLFTVFSLFVSGYKIFKRDFDLKGLITFGFSLFTVVMLTIITVI